MLNEKNVKITKGKHAFKGFANSYNVEILNSFKPESAIKSKLIDLLSELKGFKFMTTWVLVFKKVKVKIKQSMALFIQARKQE